MATIKDIIERVDNAKPNASSQKSKLKWIAELDGKIALDVMMMNIAQVQELKYAYPKDMTSEPLVGFPHDTIYDLWLGAKIDFENGEYNKYQNSMVQFNAHYGNFVRWFASTYDPARGYARDTSVTQFKKQAHYITAYGLAVKRGFKGSLDEWLLSLKGEKGDTGKGAYEYAVEAGFAGTEEAFREGLLNSGKTAYEYACDGGYTGTVAEFSAKLAAEHAPANHNHDGNYAPQNHDHAAIQTAADNAMNRANEAWNLANGKPVMTTETLTLSAAGWENGQQTLPCQAAQGTDKVVLVSPEPGVENWESYTQCGVRCIGEGDGTLAFSCGQVPGIDLTVHVAVFRNGGNADGT